MNSLMRSWLWLGLLVVVALVVPSLLVDRDGPLLPGSLGTLTLQTSVVGADAAVLVDRMHGRSVAEGENAIGVYRAARGHAVLYVTRYADADGASEAEMRMGEKIGSGDYVFRGFRRAIVDGQPVAACSGLGQEHFILSRGPVLYWLAVDPPHAEEALRSLVVWLR